MKSTRISSVLLLVMIMISITFPLANTPGNHQVIRVVNAQEPSTTPTNQSDTLPSQGGNETANQTTTQPVAGEEWWQVGANLVKYNEYIVGICYPWLVTTHFLINLPTGAMYPGTGGDKAESVTCGNRYFIVEGENGVYIFRKDIGTMFNSVYFGPHTMYIGSKDGTVGMYDILNNAVFIKFIEGNNDVGVNLTAPPSSISYSILSMIPIVAYSSYSPNFTMSDYYLANPGKNIKLPYKGQGAIYMDGNKIYLESREGIVVLTIKDPIKLTYEATDFIPLPFTITKMLSTVNGYLLVSSYGTLAEVNIDPNSAYYKTWKIIGDAYTTPIGYYVPQSKTTYVITENGVYPVPGIATAKLGNAVFTNIPVSNETQAGGEVEYVHILWPLYSTIVVFHTPFNGVMYLGDYAIKLDIEGGAYRLPTGAVLKYGQYEMILNEPEQNYPPEEGAPPEVGPASSVNYTVINFPSLYVPYKTFSNVNHIATGAGRALLIQPDKAILYSTYGPTTSIPGTWLFGGVGDCVTLYDGASFRVYDYAGNPLATYAFYITENPIYTSCKMEAGAPRVLLYYGDYQVTVGPNGTGYEDLEEPEIEDPTGMTLLYTIPYQLYYSGFIYPIPPESEDININKYWATWLRDNNAYILSLPDTTVYVLMNLPENTTIYPLDDNQILLYNTYNHKVEIIPYKSWFISKCYVNIQTDPNADVYVNNQLVGRGPLTLYTTCHRFIDIKTVEPYHHPALKGLTVTGPTTVEVYPKPIIAKVTLEVHAPANLTVNSVEMLIDGQPVQWNVGETKTLLAKSYTINVTKFEPLDVCNHPSFNETFQEGDNTLEITCNLVGSVLELYSRVDTLAKIYSTTTGTQGEPLTIQFIPSNQSVYVPLPEGEYTILSQPSQENYTAKTLNITIPVNQIVYVDVTPYPLAKIIAVANVSTAVITVSTLNGTTIKTDTGKLEVSVLPGNYLVSATAPGYEQFVQMVQASPGEISTLNITLVPVPPPKPQHKPIWQNTKFQLSAVILVIVVAALVLWWRRRRGELLESVEVEGGEPV